MEPEKRRPGRPTGKYKEFPFARLVRLRGEDVARLQRVRERGQYPSEAETFRAALRALEAQQDPDADRDQQ